MLLRPIYFFANLCYNDVDIAFSDMCKFWRGERMKKMFICSLICHNGVIGGSLCLEDNVVTYRTNKLTVDRKYRHLALPLNEIDGISWKRVIFPIATLQMRNGEKYKFLMFNQKRFQKYYDEVAER